LFKTVLDSIDGPLLLAYNSC